MKKNRPQTAQHHHSYLPAEIGQGERNTRRVIVLTAAMMIAEIIAGSVFNSMALLADGWHMASHASALGITAFAYAYARRHSEDPRYSFGTWKVGVLGGYSSAVLLAVIATLIAWESLGRLASPVTIRFDEAVAVAFVGLVVNLVSAYMLRDQGHQAAHVVGAGGHHHSDHNLRGAYLHVLADALTSLLAIFALLIGKYLGWIWMDPLVGIVGSVIIGRWSYGLLRETSRVLLDGDIESETLDEVRDVFEGDSQDRVADLHLWRIGPHHLAAILSIVTENPREPEYYKAIASERFGFTHLTVEVNPRPSDRE